MHQNCPILVRTRIAGKNNSGTLQVAGLFQQFWYVLELLEQFWYVQNPLAVSNAPISNHVSIILFDPINKYKIDIGRWICVLAFGKYNIYYNPTTGSIYLDCVKCGEETAKSAVFKMADLHKCEVISIALVFKRSFQQHNKFISKNKVHILVPWHPFSLNIIFIEFRMSGIKEYNLSGRFNSYV